MKINIKATEIVDSEIDFISLVKHGANRSPFKIVKSDDPELVTYEVALNNLNNAAARSISSANELKKQTEIHTMKLNSTNSDMLGEPAHLAKSEADEKIAREIAGLRHQLAGLYSQQQNLWESPQTPAFAKFDDELTFSIERTESELRVLARDDSQMVKSSAFFRRGGQSSYSTATVSDSAYDRRDQELRKAESQISLADNGLNPLTDPQEVAKIDLNALTF